jgi:hypothetical protein
MTPILAISGEKHIRLHFQSDNGALFQDEHGECDAGTNVRQSYVPPQCHCSSMRDTIIPAETV